MLAAVPELLPRLPMSVATLYPPAGLLDYIRSWSGMSGVSFQDNVIATRTGSVSLGLRAARAVRLDSLREWIWRHRLAAARR